jgi:hypothetical protein
MRPILAVVLLALQAPALAAPASTTSVVPASIKQQIEYGIAACRSSVYRYFADRPQGPQRGFSPTDVSVEINPILLDRLNKTTASIEAVKSAGSSYRWKVETKNASGYCDFPARQRQLIKAAPFFEQTEKQPRLVFSYGEPQ